jgi:FAD/FMN-containing dehydrogenase
MTSLTHTNGTTALRDPLAIADLRRNLNGAVYLPGDANYERERPVWNGLFDKRPAVIARPTDPFDVARAVAFARNNQLPLAVRSGGHGPAGHGTVDGGLLVDLSAMKRLSIDPQRRIAQAQLGLTWGEYAAAAQAYDLATSSGDTASVGVGGLTLSGGMGGMLRKHGLAIDHLLAVDLVTADGRLVRASDDEHPDLFWALRGGGGNFGIATAFEFQLHPAGTILGGAVLYSAAEAEHVIRLAVAEAVQAPDELTVQIILLPAPPQPFIPAERVGELAVAVAVSYVGDLAEGKRVVAPLRSLGAPIADIIRPMPYPGLFALTEMSTVKGIYQDVRSAFLRTLDDATITTIVEHARRSSQAYPRVLIRVLGGAMGRVPETATAFAHRDKLLMVNIMSSAPNADVFERQQPGFEAFWRTIQPRAEGGYVGFMMDEGAERVRAAYGANYPRLVQIKNRYDPDNVFQVNQNIPPTVQRTYSDPN